MAKQMIGEKPRRRRRTRAGTVLSEEMIVEAALRMLHEHGREGLSARRLGAALGADPSTVYRYFRSMDDLTLAIGDALIARALQDWQTTGDWYADLRLLGLRIYHAYLAHPHAAVLTASRVSGRPHEIAADEIVLSLLLSAGFSYETAARIYHVFIDQCLAFAALDAAFAALPAQSRRADEAMWRTTYAHLPPKTHPGIAATAGFLAARMASSSYPDALDMLLDNAAHQLQHQALAKTNE
ncbi:TetR family transcriptional regulator [Streptomyces hygroscopicus]|uniref:TetR/AcrR family transcriptional regulator n=1 Tax=Streptomyces hygroscopicus TaxID=1912 RepID=UPI00223F167B|nr:TetR/AcrR family transcriptional regulator [Streptomyces hygroscopicus]MCW7944367.1 TetR family transcriptional regulator [Streptomyces hygroscopicus]